MTLFPSCIQALGLAAGVVALAAVFLRLTLLKRVNARLAAANAFTEAILDAATEGIVAFDEKGKIRVANQAAEGILNRPHGALLEGMIEDLFPPQEARHLLERLKPEGERKPQGWDTMALRDGELFPIRLRIAVASVGHEPLFVCTLHDLTEQRKAEREAQYLADHDSLTGLLNLQGATQVLDNLIKQALRYGRRFACLNLALAHFSHINDLYGRDAGDAALVKLARFLRANLRAADALAREDSILVARASGAGFLIILPETDLAGARAAAERLLAGARELSFDAQGRKFNVDVNVGIALFPEHGTTPGELLSRAEAALYRAKADPVAFIHAFSPEERVEESEAEREVLRIRSALRERRFVLHFQPILHLPTGEIHHYEALVRMEDPNGALILPSRFVEVAERFGLMSRIDYRVLELAFSHLAGLAERVPDVALAVNLSASHIGDDALFKWLEGLFEEGGVLPRQLIFEITESTAVRKLLRAKAFMDPLRRLGCRFALDDFGVGFTSFAHLRSLPVDIVKIDGIFVRHLHESEEDRALVQALTGIAHSLSKEVVAEFVENGEILEIAKALGVDYAQGYFIGRPGPEISG